MENKAETSWIQLPLYSSLTEHVLLAGVPKSVLLVLIVITAIFIANFGFVYILFVTLPVYFFCVYLSRGDAQFFECYSIYYFKDDYYST